jgi:hypothetical protein
MVKLAVRQYYLLSSFKLNYYGVASIDRICGIFQRLGSIKL